MNLREYLRTASRWQCGRPKGYELGNLVVTEYCLIDHVLMTRDSNR